MKLFDKIKDTDFIALAVEDKGNVLVLSDRYGNLQFEGRLKNTPFDYILEINDNYYKENKKYRIEVSTKGWNSKEKSIINVIKDVIF